MRLALLSVTEGEDKPLKYPGLFNTADLAAVTKIDLAEACEFDRDLARANIDAVRPGMRVFETSAKTVPGSTSGLPIFFFFFVYLVGWSFAIYIYLKIKV